MTSPVLFSTGLAPVSATMRNLVEFKAGKMEMRGKRVFSSDKKGSVYLHQSQDDNLMHFCWKDRQTGVVEDDLILFPDDCEFKRVKECTTGRVYVLKMKSSNRKMFFWLQEPRTDRDEEYCKKINELLNNPPRASNDLGGGSSDRDLQTLFGNMTQEQVAQILSSNGVNLASLLNTHAGRSSSSGASASSTASTNNSAPTSAGASGASPSMNDFRALISGALMEGNEDEANALMAESIGARDQTSGSAGAGGQTGSQGGASRGGSGETQPLVDLSAAMNSESLAHLLEDDEFLRQIEPHLPPISPNTPLSSEERKKQFSDTVRSSQFRSSLSQFCIALQSGQLGPLMSQFGLNQACIDAASLGNLEAFVRALESQSSSSTSDSNVTQPQSGSQPPPSSGQPPRSDQKDKN